MQLIRPQRLGRRIKMFISITCYNEDGDELHNTLCGVAANMILLEKAGLKWEEVGKGIIKLMCDLEVVEISY